LALFAAIRRASSRVNTLAADCLAGLILEIVWHAKSTNCPDKARFHPPHCASVKPYAEATMWWDGATSTAYAPLSFFDIAHSSSVDGARHGR
jgi:hypothetical protein